jgi:hypothetical protein
VTGGVVVGGAVAAVVTTGTVVVAGDPEPTVVDAPWGTVVCPPPAVVDVTRGRVPPAAVVLGVRPPLPRTFPAESSVNRLLRQSPPAPVGAPPSAFAVSNTSREIPAGLRW